MSGKFVGTWRKTKEKVEGVTRRLLGRHEVTDVDADGYVTVRMMDEPSGTWYYYRMPQLKHRPIMPGDKALVVKMGGGYVALGAIEHASEDDAFDGDYSISAIYDPDYPTGSSNLELLLARIGQFYFWNGVKARASSVVNGRIVVELEWDKEGSGWGTSHHPARQDHQHPGEGTNSVAVGLNADASGALATAVGNGANATALNATAVGQFSNANEQSATAVGQFANAVEPSATAVGQATTADGERSFVVGAGGSTNVDDRGVLRANEVVIDRSSGSGGTRIGLRDSSGNIHWIGVTSSNITFDGSPVSGGGGGATWGSITGTLSDQTDLQNALDQKQDALTYLLWKVLVDDHMAATNNPHNVTPAQIGAAAASHTHNASDINAGTLADARIPNLAISKITNLQTSLDDKVSKSAGGTQNITGSLQLGGSIGATGAIINGGIFNGDNDNAWPWGALYINSPIISDVYGTPQWDGDTGLDVSKINGLQAALNGKANTSHTHAAGDITSGTFAAARIPNLAASKITSGTFNTARLGSGTAAKNTVLHGDGTWKQLQIGVPVWGSQQWYGPITNGSPWKAETNLNGFPNNHFATWFVPPHDTSVDRASIYVVTAGGAGSVASIAIYDDNNGQPGARVADFGSVLTNSTGTKTTSAISAVNLTGGARYWAVVATSDTPVLNGMTAWASLWGSSVNGSALCGITAIRANTNMPTNWNTGDTTFNHQVSPRVVFRTT